VRARRETAANSGDVELALYHIRNSLRLNPNQPRLIALRQELTGDYDKHFERSVMERTLHNNLKQLDEAGTHEDRDAAAQFQTDPLAGLDDASPGAGQDQDAQSNAPAEESAHVASPMEDAEFQPINDPSAESGTSSEQAPAEAEQADQRADEEQASEEVSSSLEDAMSGEESDDGFDSEQDAGDQADQPEDPETAEAPGASGNDLDAQASDAETVAAFEQWTGEHAGWSWWFFPNLYQSFHDRSGFNANATEEDGDFSRSGEQDTGIAEASVDDSK